MLNARPCEVQIPDEVATLLLGLDGQRRYQRQLAVVLNAYGQMEPEIADICRSYILCAD
ncbi:MAG: hypothetical protein WCG85_14385 [Polyangia bacterium]